jgi:hypothetical protein
MESDAICQGATAGNTWVNILTGFKTSRLCALFMIDKDGREMIISVLVLWFARQSNTDENNTNADFPGEL